MTDDCIYTTDVVLDRNGYPRVKWSKRLWRLNRLLYTFAHGNIPEGKVIGHTCNNKGCINIHHLYLTTAGENSTHAARDGLYFTGFHNKELEEASNDWLRISILYHEQGLSQQTIADMYGVYQVRVSEIIRKHKDQYLLISNVSE
jgi:hypothetical protein